MQPLPHGGASALPAGPPVLAEVPSSATRSRSGGRNLFPRHLAASGPESSVSSHSCSAAPSPLIPTEGRLSVIAPLP